MTTNSSSLKKSIQTILSSQYLAVLATSTGAAPYTSLIGFMAGKDLKQVYFATFTNTRKYDNITKHSQVSLLVDSRTNRGGEDFKNSSALTILGNAETVPQAQQSEILSLYLDKFCHLQDFANDPQCALIKINVEKYILVQRFQEVFELTMK